MTVTETNDLAGDNPHNAWRLETPGIDGWTRTARPGTPDKYLMISSDCHITEPGRYLELHIEDEYLDRIPKVETRDDGSRWLVCEGNKPMRVAPGKNDRTQQERASFEKKSDDRHPGSRMEPMDKARNASGREIDKRLIDQDSDGVESEMVFPNSGLLCWASPDPVFAMAMCRAWNRWMHDAAGEHMQGDRPRMMPMALIASGDLQGAMAEIVWAADHGFRGVCLGNQPIYGPRTGGELEYNDPSFEPMWSLLAEIGMVVTFHVSTGRDPRAVGGNGGAIINYVCHSMETTMEPLVQMITSGVFERHPTLRAGTVESGIGHVPWMLESMDYAYKAHHFWVRPVIPEPPSAYFRRNCFATFQEDHHGLLTAEDHDLVGNYLWANDYPHHEGSWPHSAEAIERTMGHLSDDSRARILGLNAAELFGLPTDGW